MISVVTPIAAAVRETPFSHELYVQFKQFAVYSSIGSSQLRRYALAKARLFEVCVSVGFWPEEPGFRGGSCPNLVY